MIPVRARGANRVVPVSDCGFPAVSTSMRVSLTGDVANPGEMASDRCFGASVMDRTAPETVLIASPSTGLRWALTRLLAMQCPATHVAEVDDEYRMLRALVEAPPDVVVMWGSLLAGDRAHALQSLRVIAPATRWILITATPSPHDAPGVQTLAASDVDRLPELLHRAAERSPIETGGGSSGGGSDLGWSPRDGHGQGDAAARAR